MTRLRREILQVGSQPAGLVHGLRERLAHFLGVDAGEDLLALLNHAHELHEVVRALDGRNLLPGLLSLVGSVNRGLDVGFGGHGELVDDFLGRGIDVLLHLAIAVVKEFSVDE